MVIAILAHEIVESDGDRLRIGLDVGGDGEVIFSLVGILISHAHLREGEYAGGHLIVLVGIGQQETIVGNTLAA